MNNLRLESVISQKLLCLTRTIGCRFSDHSWCKNGCTTKWVWTLRCSYQLPSPGWMQVHKSPMYMSSRRAFRCKKLHQSPKNGLRNYSLFFFFFDNIRRKRLHSLWHRPAIVYRRTGSQGNYVIYIVNNKRGYRKVLKD